MWEPRFCRAGSYASALALHNGQSQEEQGKGRESQVARSPVDLISVHGHGRAPSSQSIPDAMLLK